MPEGDQDQANAQPPAEPQAPKGKTFTQEDLDRINAETRRKAADTEAKRILEALGIEDVEKGKAIIKAAQAADEAAKSELQRAQEENLRLKAQADQATAKAREVFVRARVENALRDAGINPQRVEGALRLAPLGEVQVADDGSIAGVEEAVKAVKESSPEWFGAPGQPFSAPDASGGGEAAGFDWKKASADERKAALAKIGVKPVSTNLRF